MAQVITAAGSTIGAEAAAEVADLGGNAVDAAIAAVVVSMCTEPGIIAPGAGAFITVWPPDGDPVTVDGYCEMPGRADPERLGTGREEVFMTYGGGMKTNVGYSSVATPGAFAGFDLTSQSYGALPWREILQPAVRHTRDGFPVPTVTANYLEHSHDVIFGWNPESRQVVHHPDGSVISAGEILAIPDLANSLEMIAAGGSEVFYTGEIGQAITAEVHGNGGILSQEDMAAYQAVIRPTIRLEVDGWEIATNPPPAVGGAALAAVLMLVYDQGFEGWDSESISHLVAAQNAVFNYRRAVLEPADDLPVAVEQLLETARMGDLQALLRSGSTTHVSAVDSDGLGCSITASSGYGSGAMVAGTGIWLNNSLGELELHPKGFHGLKPGSRLFSNMAPTIARNRQGEVLAVGSAGADRITTALAETLLNHILLDMSLEDAVAHPRVHAETFQGEPSVAYELDLPVQVETAVRHFPQRSMYFGGVQAASWSPAAGLAATADPRRSGDVARGGSV